MGVTGARYQGRVARNISLIIAATLAAVLLAGLILYSGVDARRLARYVAGADSWPLVLLLLGTLAHIWLGATKWRAVMRRLAPHSMRQAGATYFFFYTCLSALFSLFLTVYLAGAVVRGFAARHHQKISFWRGATSSGIEQLFDAYMIVLLAIPTVVLLMTGMSFLLWAVLLTFAILVGKAFLDLMVVYPRWRRAIERRLIGASMWPLPRIGGLLNEADEAGLFDRTFVSTLYGLSLLRYAAIAVRAVAVALMAHPVFEIGPVVYGFTLVQASQFAALTPGNLGITEWSWAAVLLAFGWNLEAGTAFAIVFRVVGIAAVIVVLIGASIPFVMSLSRNRVTDEGTQG